MNTKSVISVFVLTVLLLSLSACAQTPVTTDQPIEPMAPSSSEQTEQISREPTTITIATPIDPLSLDPAFDTNIKSISVMTQVYDMLVWRDSEGELIPALAESWEFLEPTVLEMKLRQGVKFHNGDEFKADDVVFTFERLMDEANPVPLSTYVKGSVETIEKIDDYTIRITTPNPRALIIAELSRIMIVPKDAVEQAQDEFGLKPVGTGPYKFVRWDKNEKIVYEAFDDHWRGRPRVDNIIFTIMPEDFARFAALKTGEVDIISNLPPERIDEVNSTPNIHAATVHSARNIFIGMNTWEPPFNEVKIRQAVNYAVDISLIVETIFDGHAYPNGSACNKTLTGYDPNFVGYEYDPEKAKALLTEAGYPNGFEVNFWGTNGRYVKDKEVQEAVGAMLAEVGIRVKHNMPEWAEYWGKYAPGELDGLMFLGTGNPLIDCDMTMTYRFYSKTAGQYFNSPELDALIELEQSEVDPEVRRQIFVEIQEYLKENAAWLFMYDQEDLYGVNDRVSWQPRPDEYEWAFDMDVVK
jgi:peptide/nickel transport system substrate-binding protein